MKRVYKLSLSSLIVILFLTISCDNFLSQEVHTQYKPDQFLKTNQGIESLLNASYSGLHRRSLFARDYLTINAMPTNILWDYGGGYVNQATLYMNFNWDSQQGILQNVWSGFYTGIRDANSLLDNIHLAKSSLSKKELNEYKAEARFIRAADYYYLWKTFGPVPLITTSDSLNLTPKKATNEDFNSFMTKELKYAANNLPVKQDLSGKATKGAALAMLGAYSLNTHQWEKAAKFYGKVIDLNEYQLFKGDIKYQFAVRNENNKGNIFVVPVTPQSGVNGYMAHAFPPKYPIQSNWINWGTQFVIHNSFYKTYPQNDKRKSWFLTEYITIGGEEVNLLDPNSIGRGVRCFKWWPDPNAIGPAHGNDIVKIRYAQVLLGRAEALNEIRGPNPESVGLLNKIRDRAGVPEYSLSDFPTKESFRKAILKERGWEFVVESKRRMDLIRHGKFIPFAQERGKDAKEHMTVYPIPQKAIDTNPNLEQNPGY